MRSSPPRSSSSTSRQAASRFFSLTCAEDRAGTSSAKTARADAEGEGTIDRSASSAYDRANSPSRAWAPGRAPGGLDEACARSPRRSAVLLQVGRDGRGRRLGLLLRHRARRRGGARRGADRLEARRPEDHRHAGPGDRERPDDLPHHPHRHQPGDLGLRRGARRREQDVRPAPEEPAHRREPLQRGQGLPQDQAVRRAGPAGGRRLRGRDGLLGPGGQGLRRPGLPDARRPVPQPGPALRRHGPDEGRRRPGPSPQGAHGQRDHLPEDGLRDRADPRRAGGACPSRSARRCRSGR